MKICNKNSVKGLIFLALLLLTNFFATAQTITVVGSSWTPTIPAISEAGSDYGGTYTTSTGQLKLNVSVPVLLGTGKVSVSYEQSSNWHNSLKIYISKLDNGSGLCVLCSITPSGATAFQEILQTDTEFFRVLAVLNLANVNNINVNLRLSGVSVLVPVDNYSTRVIFTIGPI